MVQIHLTGGVATEHYHVQVFGLARRLAERGHDITVVTAAHDANARQESRDGYEVIYLPVSVKRFHQTLVTNLTKTIAGLKPDVLQVAELVELTTLQTVRWCRSQRIPCVVWHGAYQFYGKGVLAQKTYLGTAGRMLCRTADALIAKTSSAKAFLESLGADPNKVHVIPVGLDTDAFLRDRDRPVEVRGIPEQPFIMNVAQMIPRKNQAALIRALRIICDERPEFSLLLIGRGPEAQALGDLAKSLGLDGKVILQTERLPNTALASIYSKAFLTAMPSEYEIFGMTILESFACGTPVVGRRTGGMADIIEHGINGWLHDDDGCEALSSIALQMCKDKDLYQEFRTNAKRSSADYDWGVVAPRFLEVYEQAVAAHESVRP